MNRIVIADDHGLYRRGLHLELLKSLPGAEIFEADSLEVAIELIDKYMPIHLAILDLHMPGMQMAESLAGVVQAYPETRFVILSGSDSRTEILAALSAGLHGYIVKSQRNEDIVTALQEVLAGRIYVPALLARPARRDPGYPPQEAFEKASISNVDIDNLTPRQKDVLSLIAEGFSNKEIARELEIAEATTKIHAAAIMRTLGVRNRTEAAMLMRTWLNSPR